MLQTLRIENLALMDAVTLDFEGGFTAVTGETGAGKSILLGALALLSGARADKTLIRHGSEACTLEAVLHLPGAGRLWELLEEMGLPACEEDTLVLRRVLSANRASRVQVNGGLATQAQLQQLGHCWIDFHGPGEPQKLFHEAEQLALLDLFAGHGKELEAYRQGYAAWRSSLQEMERIRGEARLSPEEAAFLKQQLEEIDSLTLSPERLAQLEQDFRRIAGAQEMRDLCARLDESFLGGKAICERLQIALPLARKLAELDPSAAPLADRVESLVIEAGDLASEWQTLASDTEFSPSQIRKIEADMDAWLSLRRRFGGSIEAVLERRERMAERLAIQGDLQGVLDRLQKQADQQLNELRAGAAALRSGRLKAANTLAREAENLLRELGFKKPRLAIELPLREAPGPDGDCDCRMTFAPNPGQPLLPLNRIASSGEMARVMLALKSVLAGVDATPVLVFDEVDANIGGEVATSVARLLQRLGGGHQVFCITHLAQVASVAGNHFVVNKEQSEDSTAVTIECISADRERRTGELARMLGDRHSATARQHAGQMLDQSSK